jgi:hypothetical protein
MNASGWAVPLTISSEGTQNGIVWANFEQGGTGVLRAFDANDLTHELYNSQSNAARDRAGSWAKFARPTVANGKVYFPTFDGKLVVYGPLSQPPPPSWSLSVSLSASRSGAVSLDGRTLSGDAYVFTSDASGTASLTGINQVAYWLDNTAMTGTPTHVEHWVPYDFAGTAGDGTAFPWDTSTVAAGSHTITQAVTDTSGGVTTFTATFSVVASSSSPYQLWVSTSPARNGAVPLDGQALSGNVYVFTSDASGAPSLTGINQVAYWLDNTAMTGTPTHVEHWVPYDFAGTAGDGTAFPWDTTSVPPGSHTITQAVTRNSNVVTTFTASFSN